MTGHFRCVVLIICEAGFCSVEARLNPNLLKNIKCTSVAIIEMTQSVKQSKFDGLQAHIRVLECEQHMYYVTCSPGEKCMTL
uniref:Secreted protein n=1 Tax=Rhipicephalus zambeziensis TaxID=60191 RepID=A0A224YH41_9ACAR